MRIEATRTVNVMRSLNFDYLNNALRPSWRGKIHAFTTLLVPAAGGYLVSIAKSVTSILGASVYSLGLLLCFGVSAIYHVVCRTPKSQELFRRLDHGFIYVLIAGTYTPICLLVLSGVQLWLTLVLLWSCVALGMYLKLASLAKRLATAFYLVLGWLSILIVPSLYSFAGAAPVALLGLGGVLYTIGAVLFFKGIPVLKAKVFSYHEFWHAITITASAAHYAAICLVLYAA